MTFCSDAGERDELLRRFATLDLNNSNGNSISNNNNMENQHSSSSSSSSSSRKQPISNANANPASLSAAPSFSSSSWLASVAPATSPTTIPNDTKALWEVLGALRKLREGIVASKRADDFAVQAYLFCIRLSVLVKHPESYHPAILHLLRRMVAVSVIPQPQQPQPQQHHNQHPQHPQQQQQQQSSSIPGSESVLHSRGGAGAGSGGATLTSVELAEVAAYLVLDAACRRGDLAEAYALRRRYGLRDARVDAALRALAHDDYVGFMRLRAHADGHRARLLEYAEPAIRRHLLKCFARSYLAVDRAFLEHCAGAPWAALVAGDGVGWELDEGGDRVVIRRVKAR